MNQRERRKLSKKLAVMLRHRPEEYGLELDEHGWADLDDVVAALRARGGFFARVDRARIEEVVATGDKPRYELAGERLRARYGHSVPVVTDQPPQRPPAVLYHGTTRERATVVLAEGLRPMRRRYVHLSEDPSTARRVGSRYRGGGTTVLRVAAAVAHDDGVIFHRAAEGIWLCDPVPARYVTASDG